MPLFEVEVPKRNSKALDKKIASKSNINLPTANISVKSGNGLLGRINEIKAVVERNLGQYKDKYIVIREEDVLHDYIDTAIKNNIIAIDTETDGLDPLQNHIAGICIYTPGQKAAYIPIGHISYVTNMPVTNQLPKEVVAEEFIRLFNSGIDVDMFNANFDIRVLRNMVGIHNAYCTWDAYLAGRLLNENEEHRNLKYLHNKYCLDGKGDAFKFDDLFKGIPFTYIPINTGYLYAAHDPEITFELCDYQRKHLRPDHEREDMRQLYWVFKNIEMPCVDVVTKMEDTGILFDMNYQQQLSEKYNELLKEAEAEAHKCIAVYAKEIEAYKSHHIDHKLDSPINIGSPTQLAILLYDILKIEPVDKKSPRSTGVEALTKIDNPICKAILKYREINKLLSTYIDKLPECVNSDDGRIHCSFNQYGADTGRMSSSDPNLQNIPSHNKDIRKMFVASPGYVLMSSDFSQQEPKCLAALCRRQGDDQMYQTFMEGKDLYSEIASKAFNKPYEQCREFNEDGSTNEAGKRRRTQAKSILLG